MNSVINIAWLLIRVQLNKLSTFLFWLGLPIIFTFLLSQQLPGQSIESDIPILSVVHSNNLNLQISFSVMPLIEKNFSQNISGMMVMFTLIFMLTNAASLIWEKDHGTLRRFQVLPINKNNVIIGKLLGTYLMGIIQLTILALSNLFMFDLFAKVNLVGLVLMILIFGFTAASLGMLIASIARSQDHASALTLIVVLCISALGGAWWPIEFVPQYMQSLAQIFPTYWALEGFHQVMYLGNSSTSITQVFLLLIAFGICFLLMGIYKFKY